jgi:hypothetical protein
MALSDRNVQLQVLHVLRCCSRICMQCSGINVVHRIPVICKSCHVVDGMDSVVVLGTRMGWNWRWSDASSARA